MVTRREERVGGLRGRLARAHNLHRRALRLHPRQAVATHCRAARRLARWRLARRGSLREARSAVDRVAVHPEERAAAPGAVGACEPRVAGPVDGLAELKPHAGAVRDIVKDADPVILVRLRRLPPHDLCPPPALPLDDARRLRLRPAEEPEVIVHLHGAVARHHASPQAAVARHGGVSEPPHLDRAGAQRGGPVQPAEPLGRPMRLLPRRPSRAVHLSQVLLPGGRRVGRGRRRRQANGRRCRRAWRIPRLGGAAAAQRCDARRR